VFAYRSRLVLKAFVYWYGWDQTVQLFVRVVIVTQDRTVLKVVRCGSVQLWVHKVVLERLELLTGPYLIEMVRTNKQTPHLIK
jgi:hypothetical protein